jgi:hypothetical protein
MSDLFSQSFNTTTAVFAHFEREGVRPTREDCDGCHDRHWVFPWPLPGFGVRCAACIVIESRRQKDA